MIAPTQNSATGVLISGGLDSSILLASLVERGHLVQPFYIRSGVVWERQEMTAARKFVSALASPLVRPLVLLDMPLRDLYAGHWSVTGRATPDAESADEAVYLPGRNAMLLVKAAVWCQLHRIPYLALAPLGTSPFEDASAEFINHFETAINFGAPVPVRLLLPFARMDKRQVMELGRGHPLQHTFSCIAPVDGLHCGSCNKCAERQAAFRLVDLVDPTHYASRVAAELASAGQARELAG